MPVENLEVKRLAPNITWAKSLNLENALKPDIARKWHLLRKVKER